MSHKARKRFGQNFLVDRFIKDEIIRHFQPAEFDHVIEIGPGQGALTEYIAGKTKSLTLLEIDRDLIEILTHRFHQWLNYNGQPNQMRIIEGDALNIEFNEISKVLPDAPEKFRIIGNLPYNISTPIMFHCIRQRSYIKDALFMLQKEVVDRITALPNTKDYGRLSVMTQFHCQVDKLFDVPPNAFKPAPKVTSAILHLSPHLKSPYQTCDTEKLMTVVTKAFSQRRKQLSNTLATLISKEALEDIQIDPSQRAENLSVESFVNITNALN